MAYWLTITSHICFLQSYSQLDMVKAGCVHCHLAMDTLSATSGNLRNIERGWWEDVEQLGTPQPRANSSCYSKVK